MDEQKSGFFGLGSSFLLSASFVSSNHEDENAGNVENAENNAENNENAENIVNAEINENAEDMENYEADDQSYSYDYLMPKEELEKVKVETIEGDKSGSIWLVLDDVFMLYKYGYEGKEETFWECSERRRNNCKFKAATLVSDNPEALTLSYSYKFETHSCTQSKSGPIMQKFKTKIKRRMQNEYKNKFRKIFDEEKKVL